MKAALLAACCVLLAGYSQDPEPLKIAFIGPLTGDQSPWGQDALRAVELAVEEVNAKDGVRARKIELLVYDDASRPEVGKSSGELALEEGIVAAIGGISSGIAAPTAMGLGRIPYMVSGGTRPDLTSAFSNIYRTAANDEHLCYALANFAYNDLGLRRVGVFTDTRQPYSIESSKSFRKVFESLGGKIVHEETYEFGRVDFSAQAKRVSGVKLDAIFISGCYTEAGPIARQLRGAGCKAQLLGSDAWDSRELLQGGGEAIVGGFFVNHFAFDDNDPTVKGFLARFRKKWGAPPQTALGPLAYDAAAVLFDAMARSGDLSPKGIGQAILSARDVPGGTGLISMRPDREAAKHVVVMRVEEDGFRFVKRVSTRP